MAKRREEITRTAFGPSETGEEWAAQGWDDESAPVTVTRRLEATISIRLDPQGARLLRQAARLSGLTRSAFVRRATIQAATAAIERAEQTPIEVHRLEPITAPPFTGSSASDVVSREPETSGASRSTVTRSNTTKAKGADAS